MGGNLTIFENKSSVDMEFRVFVPPDRPNHFRKTINIKSGERKAILVQPFYHRTANLGRPVMIMLFADNAYTGVSLHPRQLLGFRRVICDRREDGSALLRGTKASFIRHCRPGYCKFLLGVKCCGIPKEEMGGEISSYFSSYISLQ